MPSNQTNRDSIRVAKQGLTRRLLGRPGISGVGIEGGRGRGERLKVYLSEDTPAVRSIVPDSVDGYPVVMETIGPARVLGG